MYNRFLPFLLILAGCLLPLAAEAQVRDGAEGTHPLEMPINRFEIRDGRVIHNGTALPADAIPEDLDIEGITFSFSYSGPVMPALTLGGRIYVLEEGRLVTLEQSSGSPQAVAVLPVEERDRRRHRRNSSTNRAYLESLSERDDALYRRLLREQEMEEELRQLAEQYHQAGPDERTRIRSMMLAHLEELFDIKQENRLEEIRQVELLLEEMRQELNHRNNIRERIINRWLNHFLR